MPRGQAGQFIIPTYIYRRIVSLNSYSSNRHTHTHPISFTVCLECVVLLRPLIHSLHKYTAQFTQLLYVTSGVECALGVGYSSLGTCTLDIILTIAAPKFNSYMSIFLSCHSVNYLGVVLPMGVPECRPVKNTIDR